MIIKENYEFTNNSMNIVCTKSTKINLFNYVPENIITPIQKIKLDSNDISYDGHSKILNAYLPLLDGYDLVNDNELSKEEVMMLSLIMLGSKGLSKMAEDNTSTSEKEFINSLIEMLTMMEEDSINGKNDVCCLFVNCLDEVK